MIYRREHPNTPSKRFRSVILNPIGSKIVNKFFFKTTQSLVGKHFGKKTCLRRKKTIYQSKFNLVRHTYCSKPGVVTQISLARRYKTFVGLVTYSNGLISCLPLFSGASINYVIKTWEYVHNPKLFFFSSLKTGYTVPLGYLTVTMCFFNVTQSYNRPLYFCRSGGTFCTLMRYNIEKGACVVRLPSVKLLTLNESNYVMLGRNSNTLPKGVWLGKAGFNIKKGFRPSVRGVAKNPVDHPHGGRTKTNSPERTPWGRVAKYNK